MISFGAAARSLIGARAKPLLGAALLALMLTACSTAPAERLTVKVVAQYPHDPGAFTQGLLLADGRLYESTGLVGRSSLREVRLEDGVVLLQRDVPPPYFAEGLALVGDELLQLTWQHGTLLRYDRASLEPRGETSYEGEGWGLCYDGAVLWMSDGSATLTKRDARSFASLGTVEVKLDGKPLTQLNELECVNGLVYANVWLRDDIARIDPSTGRVTGIIDASSLRAALRITGNDAVLNGVAYDDERDLFLVTGKLWPALFAVRFEPR